MKTLAILSALAALGLATAAQAQGALNENPPTRTEICLDVNGGTLPAVCRVPASRLDQREDICVCPRVCAPLRRSAARMSASRPKRWP